VGILVSGDNFNLLWAIFSLHLIVPWTQRSSLAKLFGSNLVVPQAPSVSGSIIASLSMAHGNGQQQARAHMEDKLVDDNFTTTHRLSLRVDSHSLTLSFTLDMLAQHMMLIGKIQDEVDFLRRQGEVMQSRLDVRDTSPNTSVQSHNEEVGSRPGTNEQALLSDLNMALEPPADEDSIKKEQ
jgi:hypothetical protein